MNQQNQNQVICLYTNDTSLSSTSANYYGFGLNSYTLRYQVPVGSGFYHTWYAGTNQVMQLNSSGQLSATSTVTASQHFSTNLQQGWYGAGTNQNVNNNAVLLQFGSNTTFGTFVGPSGFTLAPAGYSSSTLLYTIYYGGVWTITMSVGFNSATNNNQIWIVPWNSSTYSNIGATQGIYTNSMSTRLAPTGATGFGYSAAGTTSFTGYFASNDTIGLVAWSSASATVSPVSVCFTRVSPM